MNTANYITEIIVTDPDTLAPVNSPFNGNEILLNESIERNSLALVKKRHEYLIIGRLCNYDDHAFKVLALNKSDAETQANKIFKQEITALGLDSNHEIYIEFIISSDLQVLLGEVNT